MQLADIFTKGHTTDRFCYLHDKLSVYDLLVSLRGAIKETSVVTTNDKDRELPPTSSTRLHLQTTILFYNL